MAFIAVLFSRNALFETITNHYLIEHDTAVTCIDFRVNSDFDLVINRLCIDSPYAQFELIDSKVSWHFSRENLSFAKALDAVSAITINTVNITGKDKALISTNKASQALKVNELPELIRQQLNELASVHIPFILDVNAFTYQPFASHDIPNVNYEGQVSAKLMHYRFSLAQADGSNVISFAIDKQDDGFDAQLKTQLAELKIFATQHQKILPISMAALVSASNREAWTVLGSFNSDISWYKNQLIAENTLLDFTFDSQSDSLAQTAFELEANLAWQWQLTDNVMQTIFASDNILSFSASHAQLLETFMTASSAEPLVTFLHDNSVNDLLIKPSGVISIDFASQQISGDSLVIESEHSLTPINISVNDFQLSFTEKPAIAIDLKYAGFSLFGMANVSQLAQFSQQPVKVDVTGKVNQSADVWQVSIFPRTKVEVLGLRLGDQKLRAKALLSRWQGELLLDKTKADEEGIKVENIDVNLETTTQVTQLQLSELMQFKTLASQASISGNIDDLSIKGDLIADNLLVAKARLSGELFAPQLELFADDILMTELLALNIKQPIDIKLIDGKLKYRLSGQIQNTEDLLKNAMALTVLISDVSGDIDGVWMQEINWQQAFAMQDGKVKSVPQKANNLTIAKIETATPIAKLSTQTMFDYRQDDLKLTLKNTQGNMLGGRFDFALAQWPFTKDLAVDINLTDIDLEKLLALDQKQGIVVTGRVSGQLPVYYDGDNFLIQDGHLYNTSKGLIQIFNNPAVDELKSSSTELKLAFDALENLQYHHLSSEVSMSDDGYMLLDTAIKGRNPDLDNDVNLNLNLSYDLLGLLESLNITEHFENKVIKGLQN
jgi:hypothetical protein